MFLTLSEGPEKGHVEEEKQDDRQDDHQEDVGQLAHCDEALVAFGERIGTVTEPFSEKTQILFPGSYCFFSLSHI